MKVYAFVGPSGTGKSHNSQNVAFEKNIEYIIDDALLIKGNKVIAGRSAKTEPTKIGSVKAALFTDESRRDAMRKAIKAEKIQNILILGTSDEMVARIAENLNLPESEENLKQLRKKVRGIKIVPISAATDQSFDKVKDAIRSALEKRIEEESQPDYLKK